MAGGVHDEAERLHVETAAQWRDWLARHHDRDTGVWVVWWRRSTGRPAPAYDDLVTEALAQGWIDATSKGLDEERTMMWFTRRRPGSGWSRPNKQRVERLYAEGRMRPAGQAVLDRAVADGSWTLLDDVEDLVVPDDLAAALAERGVRATWDGLGRSARRAHLVALVTAKRPETRARRLRAVVDAVAGGSGGPAGVRPPG